MVNKNDLRFIKTERLIKETYMRLKRQALKQGGHGSIKVSELCASAMINKTTFYTHYETMDALHRQICEEEIDRILSECLPIDVAFLDTAAFVDSIVEAILKDASTLNALFGEDKMQSINAFEAGLLKRYLRGATVSAVAGGDGRGTAGEREHEVAGTDECVASNECRHAATGNDGKHVTTSADAEADAKIRFCIGGAARLLLDEQSPEQLRVVTDLIKKVL